MRLWSIHPKYLDAKGLVALWREGLLAQKVLLGKTKGYRHHPQLDRFRSLPDPLRAIGFYLYVVHVVALKRGYHFQENKILKFARKRKMHEVIKVTRGQLLFEFNHFKKKLLIRTQKASVGIKKISISWPVKPHPIFKVVPGKVELFEKTFKK